MFDYSLFYIIGIAILLIGAGFGLTFLMRKYNIKSEDIVNGVDLTKTIINLVKSMARDMGYGNQEEIEKVAEIINDSLNYVKSLTQVTSKEDKINNTIIHVQELCIDFNIPLNEDRIAILNTLVVMTYNLIEAVEKK